MFARADLLFEYVHVSHCHCSSAFRLDLRDSTRGFSCGMAGSCRAHQPSRRQLASLERDAQVAVPQKRRASSIFENRARTSSSQRPEHGPRVVWPTQGADVGWAKCQLTAGVSGWMPPAGAVPPRCHGAIMGIPHHQGHEACRDQGIIAPKC